MLIYSRLERLHQMKGKMGGSMENGPEFDESDMFNHSSSSSNNIITTIQNSIQDLDDNVAEIKSQIYQKVDHEEGYFIFFENLLRLLFILIFILIWFSWKSSQNFNNPNSKIEVGISKEISNRNLVRFLFISFFYNLSRMFNYWICF